MNSYWSLLFKYISKCHKSDDIPVSALIEKDGNIISIGYNTRKKTNNVLGHAEINAIIKANKKMKTWNLSDCNLYVLLKPCSMCMEIIKQSRIKNVYYLLDKLEEKKEYSNVMLTKVNEESLEKDYKEILSDFFCKLRDKK